MTIETETARRKVKRVYFADGGDGHAYAETPHGMAIIDIADLEEVKKINWYWRPPKGLHTARIVGFSDLRGVDLGRFLIEPIPEGMFVDHINRNALDNRRSNLRHCTHAENMRNRPGSSNRKSKYKGVYKCRGRWRAEISHNGKKFRLGAFNNAEKAARAYDAAAIKLHGDFARTNTSMGLL